MAAIHLLHSLRAQCIAIRQFPDHKHIALHDMAQDMDGNASTPCTKLISWHISNGSGNHYQHDCIRLRA